MVTIEQKLTVFSKLLNQDIKEEMDEKFAQLDREYEKRLAESKFEVDRRAAEIVDQARKCAEIKKIEVLSRSKLLNKREMTKIKEEMIQRFMEALEKKVIEFIQTQKYLDYLKQMISSFKELGRSYNQLEVYLTQRDYNQNLDFIQREFEKLGIKEDRLDFKVTTGPILGGLVILDIKDNVRIDGSISGVIEEAQQYIVEKVSKAIGEVGEKAHE
ncbi:MAG: hypothetical protein IIY08_08755 [Cellulosilyticum sp.]|nr:hypothetical protein [Cellulosilyticum sp.]